MSREETIAKISDAYAIKMLVTPINWKHLTGNSQYDLSIGAAYSSLQEALKDLKRIVESKRAFEPLTTEDGSILIDKAQILRLWKFMKM